MLLFLKNFCFIIVTALQDWASFKHIYHLVTTSTLLTPERPKKLLVTPWFSSHFHNIIKLFLKL